MCAWTLRPPASAAVPALPMQHKRRAPLGATQWGGPCSCLACQGEPLPFPNQQVPVPRALKWKKPKTHVKAACLDTPSPLRPTSRIFINTRAGEKSQCPAEDGNQQATSAQSLPPGPLPAAGFDRNNLQCIRYDLLLIMTQLEKTKGDSASLQNLS